MYNIGDTFTINNSEYTIWLVDTNIYTGNDGIEHEITLYHLKNNQGHGLCSDEEYLTSINL